MASFYQLIIEAIEDGDKIEWLVLGDADKYSHIPRYDEQPKYRVIDWKTGYRWTQYDFDIETPPLACNRIVLWSKHNVYFLRPRNGKVVMICIPRNPQAHIPFYVSSF